MIAAFVTDFFERFGGDPQLVPLLGGINAASGTRIHQHFVDFICAHAGGPCLYHGRDMKTAHEGLVITKAQFEAVVRHMNAALDALKVGAAEKKELMSLLSKFDFLTARTLLAAPQFFRQRPGTRSPACCGRGEGLQRAADAGDMRSVAPLHHPCTFLLAVS